MLGLLLLGPIEKKSHLPFCRTNLKIRAIKTMTFPASTGMITPGTISKSLMHQFRSFRLLLMRIISKLFLTSAQGLIRMLWLLKNWDAVV